MSNVKKSVAERTRHQRQYDRRVDKRQMQTSGTESGKQDTSNKSGNDTDADNADIKPIYDKEPMVEVQLTDECNVTATGQHHTEQPEIIHEGRVDQYTEQCQVKSPMLNLSLDNKITESSNQSLEFENIWQHYKAKIKHDIDKIETINIELKHSVAKLLVENEHLNKKKEHLKQTYKDLYDSIKKARVQMKDHNDSLIAQMNKKSIENADLKAQIQEKKTSPRSGLRWKPTGRIFENVGLRWIPTGKLLDSCTSKVNSEPPNGSNTNFTKPHECKQTLDSSAGTSINVQKEQTLHLSAGTSIDRNEIKALINENVIARRPWSHEIILTKAKEISARPKSQGIQN
ncbi:hypothetical protein Tco_0762228 [Tanacetum coccineum]